MQIVADKNEQLKSILKNLETVQDNTGIPIKFENDHYKAIQICLVKQFNSIYRGKIQLKNIFQGVCFNKNLKLLNNKYMASEASINEQQGK